MFPTDTSIRPDELAVEVEARGFESLWFPEHSHIPVSRKTPWGGVEGAPPLPEQYWHTIDQFVALAYAARATTTLRIGSGITLVAQRDPIWTAKEAASVDFLSGGRLLFGVGYGWNKEEMGHHGTSYKQRRALFRERILMIKTLWTMEEASFQGEHHSLEPSWAWPKPAQKPHPPIILGAAAGPKTVIDLVDLCDGWMPLATRHDIAGQIDRVRQAVADAGGDPSAFEITASGAKVENVDTLTASGVDRVIFNIPPLGADVVVSRLDMLAAEAGLVKGG